MQMLLSLLPFLSPLEGCAFFRNCVPFFSVLRMRRGTVPLVLVLQCCEMQNLCGNIREFCHFSRLLQSVQSKTLLKPQAMPSSNLAAFREEFRRAKHGKICLFYSYISQNIE